MTYRDQPAVIWSSDDSQFVPYIRGSAWLATKSPIEPAQIVVDSIMDVQEGVLVGCIDFIRPVKTSLCEILEPGMEYQRCARKIPVHCLTD